MRPLPSPQVYACSYNFISEWRGNGCFSLKDNSFPVNSEQIVTTVQSLPVPDESFSVSMLLCATVASYIENYV